MNKQLLSWLSYCLVVFAVLLAACSHLNLPEPQAPATTPSAALLTATRDWFAQITPATARPVVLNWEKAHNLDGWLLIPLADTISPFAAEHKRAYRYLVAQNTTGSAFTGRIVEVVLEGKTPVASSVEQTIVAATKRLLATPQAPAPLPGITGLLLFYSPAYSYETGYVYEKGQPLAQRVRLLRSPRKTAAATPPKKGASPQGAIDNPTPVDCLMELRCGYTGDYEYLSNCIYVPHCFDPTSDGGGGDGGWGGGGGGGGSDPTSESTVTVITNGPKVDPKEEVKCFTTSQPATVTIYVNQPVPGTTTLQNGTVGVGHTFIGIEQNGITRYMGYYPPANAGAIGIGVGKNYVGEVHDDSGHDYNVSISTSVSGSQLSTILTYLNNDVPTTYNLNSYNCADFGIVIGNLAGLNIPATTTSSGIGPLIIFNGRSPAQLGQDIRNTNPQTGVTIDSNGGSAPTKQGGC